MQNTCVLFFILLSLAQLQAFAQSGSSVYRCYFTDEVNPVNFIRMKEYFDAKMNMEVGKVDLLKGADLLESTYVKVYSVPIYESETYVKMWYSPSVRVDAQMSWSESSREFLATYSTSKLKRQIYCAKQAN